MIKINNGAVKRNHRNLLLTRILRIPEIGIIIPLVGVILIFTLIQPVFISYTNITVILKASSFWGIIVIGMAFSLIVGQIDLSVGSVVALTVLISSSLIVRVGIPIWVSLILSLMAAILVGLVNGVLSVKFKIPSIIVTLGMMFAIRGLAFLVSKGFDVYPLPESLVNFGKATPLGLSWNFFIFIVLVIISDFILRKTIIGRKIYATGANVLVARINGINTNLVKILIHVLTSFLAGLAGILLMIKSANGATLAGLGWEFPIIAGTIIGGVSLLGGFGTVWGAFLGIILLQVIYNGLVIVGLQASWQNIIVGIIMVLTAGFDIWRRTKTT